MNARQRLRLLSLAAACGVGGLHAWVPVAGEPWPDGQVLFALETSATAPAGSTGDWDAAAREAMAAWNASLQRIQLATAPATGRPSYDNGRNEVFFDEKIYDEFFPSGVLAVTFNTVDRGVLIERDIVFNASLRWAVYRGPLQRQPVDFRRVAIHELGHVLGLDHPDEAGQSVTAIMNSVVGAQEVPSVDDLEGARALYDRGNGVSPVIVGLSRATTGYQGNAARLEVAVGGRGPLRYEWRRAGIPIPGGTGAALEFAAVALADAGAYTVIVSSAGGSVTSPPVVLTVVPAELPVVSLSTQAASVTAGATVSVRASVNRGSRPMRYGWAKDGRLVKEGMVNDSFSTTLTLADIQIDEAGEYLLTLSNAAGSATAPAVRIAVAPGSPPRFVSDLPTRAVSGGFIVLEAPVVVSPPATYQWKRDGVDIPGATEAQWRTSDFGPGLTGTYTVTVTNSYGQATSGGGLLTLPTQGGLQIHGQPQAVTTYPGSNVRFVVEQPNDRAALRWLKDGVPLSDISPGGAGPSAGLSISGSRLPELMLLNVRLQDAGEYAVEISDGASAVRSRAARLILLSPPKPVIVSHPSHYTVAPGATINLAIETIPAVLGAIPGSVPGNAPLAIQWFKDGAPIQGATRSSYSLVAQPGDTGRYFARVSNANGATDSEISEVTVAPGSAALLPVQLGNQYYDQGNEEAMRLLAVALEVWRRRNNPGVDSAEWRRISPNPASGNLLFSPRLVPGIYVLAATRGGVSETSRPVYLGFWPVATPVITVHPRGGQMAPGAMVALSVGVTSYDAASYQWTRDGVAVPGATAQILTLPNFSPAQVGGYRVTVSNSGGATVSEPAAIELRPGTVPTILAHPVGRTVTAGQAVVFEVSAAAGTGFLRYQWLRSGQPIAGATQERLALSSVGPADGAGYSVAVSDAAATVTSLVATLRVFTVNRPPDILFPPTNQTAILGGDAIFAVGADGAPLPDRYQWRKDGVDIPGATGAKLRLQDVQASQAGSYSVVAYNMHGATTSGTARLTVDARGRLVNLATRASVGAGPDVLIAGFVISGAQPRTVLVRAIGDRRSTRRVRGAGSPAQSISPPVRLPLDAHPRQRRLVAGDRCRRGRHGGGEAGRGFSAALRLA